VINTGTHLCDLFYAILGAFALDEGRKLLCMTKHDRSSKVCKLGVVIRMILRVPVTSKDAVVLRRVGLHGPVITDSRIFQVIDLSEVEV